MPPLELEKFKTSNQPLVLDNFKVAPPTPTETFKQRLSSARERRFGEKGIASDIEKRVSSGQQTFGEGVFQIAGQGVASLTDIIFESVRAITPEPIRGAIAGRIEKVVSSPVAQKTIEGYKEFKKRNPRVAANIEASFNVGAVVPTTLAGRGAVAATRVGAGVARGGLEKSLAKQQLEEAITVSRKPLTAPEKEAAVASGNVKANIFGQIQSLPTARDLEVADAVKGIVNATKNPVTNVQNILRAVDEIDTRVDVGLENNNAIFNIKQLRAKLSETKEESRIIFGGDRAVENAYDSIVNEFVKLMNGRPKTVKALRSTRKEFDSIVKRKFPNVFKNPYSDNVRHNAILDVRQAANEYVAELLPPGNTYGQDLRKMSNMLRATKNIGNRVRNIVDVPLIQRLMTALRENVVVHGFTGGIITAAGLGALFSNPFLLGLALLGGTVKVGNKIVTSKTLKSFLIKVFDKLEKGGNSVSRSDKVAVLAMIHKIDEYSKYPKLGLSIEDVSKKPFNFQSPKTGQRELSPQPTVGVFKGFPTITTKVLEKLRGKSITSKQEILDFTNMPELKQAERDLIRRILEDFPDKVNVKEFANKVKTELLPLKAKGTSNLPGGANISTQYENITLPDELRGPVANYGERIYESPIKTSAGDVHFGRGSGASSDSYFAHTRIEDLPNNLSAERLKQARETGWPEDMTDSIHREPGNTRRVIELQSDLFQKGRLEQEGLKPRKVYIEGEGMVDATRIGNRDISKGRVDVSRQAELSRLEPYRNTWHERIIREEVKQAAKDGKTKLQFPTGETALKIEGLGGEKVFKFVSENKYGVREVGDFVDPTQLKKGQTVYRDGFGDWLITKVEGEGIFSAVSKKNLIDDMKFRFKSIPESDIISYIKNCL